MGGPHSTGALIGAVAGAIVGSAIPGVGTFLGASLGGFIGGLAGGLYDTLTSKDPRIEQASINDLTVQTSTYGLAIPQVWGSYPISGNIIWASPKKEVQHREHQSGGKGGKAVTTITKTYTQSFAMCLADTRITGPMAFVVKIWRDNTIIYDRAQTGGTLPDGWTFYPGNDTQVADPTIEAVQGVGVVPGYRWRSYVVKANDDLGAAGIPHIYKIQVARDGDNVVTSFLTDYCVAAGIPSAQVDVSALDPAMPLSMAIINVEQARAPIEQVLEAYRLYAIESSRTLAFRRRGAGSVIAAVPEEDVAAGENTHAEGGVQITRQDTGPLPTELNVSYIDAFMHFQTAIQSYILARAVGLPSNQRALSTSIALESAQAKQWAVEALNEAWAQRETVTTTLSRRYATLEPGDRITLAGRGILYDLVVTETSYGYPGILEIHATIDAAYVADPPDPPGDPDPWPIPIVSPAATTAILLNLPALGVDETPRYHVGFVPGVTGQWDGATLHRSVDAEATYQEVARHTIDLITGMVASATPAGVTHAFDNGTVITVVMDHGALASVSDAGLASGQNLFSLGQEVLSAGTVTLIAANTYQLTHLYRGRRGTEHRQATHGTNERLVLLDHGGKAVPMTLPDAGIARAYKAVTFGQDIADITSVSFTPTAANMLPFTAWQIKAVLLDGGAWQILWQYRPRFGGDWVTGERKGFDGDHAGFHVHIYANGSYSTIVRTIWTDGMTIIDATAGKGVVYLADEQLADFGITQTTIYYDVAQLTNFGPGYAAPQVAP